MVRPVGVFDPPPPSVEGGGGVSDLATALVRPFFLRMKDRRRPRGEPPPAPLLGLALPLWLARCGWTGF